MTTILMAIIRLEQVLDLRLTLPTNTVVQTFEMFMVHQYD